MEHIKNSSLDVEFSLERNKLNAYVQAPGKRPLRTNSMVVKRSQRKPTSDHSPSLLCSLVEEESLNNDIL